MTHPCESFYDRQTAWSAERFGPAKFRGPRGPLRHLVSEVTEVKKALAKGGGPEMFIEIADCLTVVYDAAFRGGLSYARLRTHKDYPEAVSGRPSLVLVGAVDLLMLNASRAAAGAHTIEEYQAKILTCHNYTLIVSRAAGLTLADLLFWCEKKHKMNLLRQWGEPTADGAVEHIRGGGQ